MCILRGLYRERAASKCNDLNRVGVYFCPVNHKLVVGEGTGDRLLGISDAWVHPETQDGETASSFYNTCLPKLLLFFSSSSQGVEGGRGKESIQHIHRGSGRLCSRSIGKAQLALLSCKEAGKWGLRLGGCVPTEDTDYCEESLVRRTREGGLTVYRYCQCR